MILQILTFLGALGMFLYGMNQMSSGLQKVAGNKMRGLLASMTSNPFKRVLTGLGITSIIQSSSATTVMVVSFVNAGLLGLTQAVGVIMGANIGTTVTAWIIALFGFKMDISVLAVPLMALGFILSVSSKEKGKNTGEFVIGFALLFLGLAFMKEAVPDLSQSPQVLEFIKSWTGFGFGSVLIFLLIGTVLTLILQSSSATMALTLIMLNMGWIPFPMAAAMVLGENIGTTITANLAASVGNTASKRAALAHTLFNMFGIVWALIFFKPFLNLVGWIITLFGLENPNGVVTDSTSLLYGLSMLHTLFNVINTLILVWFTDLIVKIVSAIIKEKPEDSEDLHKLKYISSGRTSTAELALQAAIKETGHFAEIMKKGFHYAREAINAEKLDYFEKMRQKLVKYEEISDRIESEIATYLNTIPAANLGGDSIAKIRTLYQVIDELESLGDSGESISRILGRRNKHKQKFDEEATKKLNSMLDLVDQAYDIMIENMEKFESCSLTSIKNAEDIEDEIDLKRNVLKSEVVKSIEEGESTYLATVYYMDLITELERMGDYMINVSQSLECDK